MKTLQVLLKPASSACDIKCTYCFYRDEAAHRKTENAGYMKREVALAVIEKALEFADTCTFAFQGGEPTLAGLDFYREFVELVNTRKGREQQIYYSIQTNACRLDESWVGFLRENHFLVGVSLDGVRNTHDANRKDSGGEGTFHSVFENVRKLQRMQVPFHVLCVLNRQTAERAEAIYRFFCRKGFWYQQYIPCLDSIGDVRGEQEYSLGPKLYAQAMKKLFDLWFEDQRMGKPIYIRQFSNYLDILRGEQPEACAMYGRCSLQNVIEADGSVYPCDFYALDEYYMGNILETDFARLRKEAQEERPGSFFESADRRDERCGRCRWYPLCRGGCRRDCVDEGERRRNYYCEAYQEFFEYAVERLEWLVSRMGKR